MEKKGAYVDVRGNDPVYIEGLLAVTLYGAPRNISVEDAKKLAEEIMKKVK